MKKLLLSLILLVSIVSLILAYLHTAHPSGVRIDMDRISLVDKVINTAIDSSEIPGAVLTVIHNKDIKYIKAYGNKQVYPTIETMTTDAVFDIASLSKSVSTAIATMKLIEDGQIRLYDNVDLFIPNFLPWKNPEDTTQKTSIKIIHLLTHTSGLPGYAPVAKLQEKYSTPNPDGLIEHIAQVDRRSEPSTNFDYSCLNFVVLQRIIEKVSGKSLQEYAQENIFRPLGMNHTDYNPTGKTLAMVVPTEIQKDSTVLKGLVHDPLARIMNGGVSGNAGIFSNANDLAKLVAMLLNKGELNGVRILSPLSVERMTSVPYGYEQFGRALGWDVYSPYASDGDLYKREAYGHTGYTGTSLTIDQKTKTAIILLTNRVHPHDSGAVGRLRGKVANIVASSIIE